MGTRTPRRGPAAGMTGTTFLTDEACRLSAEIAVADALRRGSCVFQMTSNVEMDTILIERTAHPSEGVGPIRKAVRQAFQNTQLTPKAVSEIEAHLEERRALDLRDEALKEAGCDPRNPPPWSFIVHPLAAAMVKARGLDSGNLGRIHADRQVSGGIQTLICSDDGVSMTLEGTARGMRAALVVREAGRRTVYGDAGGKPFLATGEDMPDSVLHSLVGKAIGDVLADRRFREQSARIVGVSSNDAGIQFLELERIVVPLAPPPEGADVSWMSSAFGWTLAAGR